MARRYFRYQSQPANGKRREISGTKYKGNWKSQTGTQEARTQAVRLALERVLAKRKKRCIVYLSPNSFCQGCERQKWLFECLFVLLLSPHPSRLISPFLCPIVPRFCYFPSSAKKKAPRSVKFAQPPASPTQTQCPQFKLSSDAASAQCALSVRLIISPTFPSNNSILANPILGRGPSWDDLLRNVTLTQLSPKMEGKGERRRRRWASSSASPFPFIGLENWTKRTQWQKAEEEEARWYVPRQTNIHLLPFSFPEPSLNLNPRSPFPLFRLHVPLLSQTKPSSHSRL